MEILISNNKFLHHPTLLLQPQLPHFTSLHPLPFPQQFYRSRRVKPPLPILCSTSSPISTNYNGWEDLALTDDPIRSSKFHKFQNFLISIGIDDKKHVFMFILGFVSALAVSRVRVSSILVFPASVLVFSAGFTLGLVRKDTSVIGSKNVSKDENFRVSDDKLRGLVEVFSELGGKVVKLEEEMRGALELGTVQVSEVRDYYNVVKDLSLDILRANDTVEGRLDGDGQVDRNLNQRLSRKKKEPAGSYFDVFKFIGGLFQENVNGPKPNKVKDALKTVNRQNQDWGSTERTEEGKEIGLGTNGNIANDVRELTRTEASRNQDLSQCVAGYSVNGAGKEEVVRGLLNENYSTIVNEVHSQSSSEEFSHRGYSSQFFGNNGNFMKFGHQNGKGIFIPEDKLYEPLDFDVNRGYDGLDMRSFNMGSKASLQQTDSPAESNEYQEPSNIRKKLKKGGYNFDFIEREEILDGRPNLGSQRIGRDSELYSASSSSSSMISEDLMFHKHLTEAADLIKEARGCLKGKSDEERTEVILYKSARLLSKAAAMKPMSLLAVGQLGNTYLLHGELKLRISRELRAFLSRNNPFSRGKTRIVLKVLDEENMTRDRIASILIDVCEECEGLLVEAGRQYRMALSIDGSDVRALYNWGLALSYRAQLIADVGPEAASDADRVYLAAIDKFNAMMSRNKAYAPDALFRWGVVLQQRSRLWPNSGKDQMKLLHQAKSLFEDALCMDSNNVQVREALSDCIYELKYRHL